MLVKVYCAHRKRKKGHRETTIEELTWAQNVAGNFFCLHCKRRIQNVVW